MEVLGAFLFVVVVVLLRVGVLRLVEVVVFLDGALRLVVLVVLFRAEPEADLRLCAVAGIV